MKLRPTEESDLELVMTWIRNEEECRLWSGPGVRFPYTLATLKEDIRYDSRNTFSLLDNDGYACGLGQILEKSSNKIHLARILIAPAERGKGYGRILCSLLIEKALEIYGKRSFSLNVYEFNTPAVKTYQRLGFKQSVPPPGSLKLENCMYMVLSCDDIKI